TNFINEVKTAFADEDPMGLLRLLEKEAFKDKMRKVGLPYKKKLPRKKKVVVKESDVE
ncbi:hypothetical protein HK097_001762, partial [Rhizophlyctis rosea]